MCTVVYALNDIKEARKYCNEALNIIEKEKHPNKEVISDIYAMMGYINFDYYNNKDITIEYDNENKKISWLIKICLLLWLKLALEIMKNKKIVILGQ